MLLAFARGPRGESGQLPVKSISATSCDPRRYRPLRHNMSFFPRVPGLTVFGPALLPLFGVALLSMSGCSGCTPIPNTTGKLKDDNNDYPPQGRELYRKAVDAASFRFANAQVNEYLNNHPAALAKYQPASADRAKMRALLETVVGLDKAEIDETESGTFKLLDGSYLESCFLLR